MDKKEVIDYFMEATVAKFDRVEKRFDKVDEKLEMLIGFRWMLLGSSATISAIVGIIIAIWFSR